MRIGTSHFVSLKAAERYYSLQGYGPVNVRDMLVDGDISIGKPALQPGDRLVVVDNGTRYAIETQLR